MKTAISIPDPTFEAAEKLARRLGWSRSQLYSNAVDEFIKKNRYGGVTEQLDAVYKVTPETGHLDPAIEALQSGSIDQEDW